MRVEGVLDIDTARGGNGMLLDVTRMGKRRRPTPLFPKS